MTTLFVNGAVAEDVWISVEGDQPIPGDVDVIVSVEMFRAHPAGTLGGRTGRLGVFLTADEQIDALADRLGELDLIALEFPSFADGRAFSKARLLREDHCFKGEVRGVGDIRIDQIAFMNRCGFDALLVHHQATIDALVGGDDPSLHLFYQPALGEEAKPAGAKSWTRRSSM